MAAPKRKESRLEWYYAPAFLLFWFVLFFAVVVPVFLNLPNGLTMDSEQQHPHEFIAERAERILYDFEKIGPKVTGSYANENLTVQLLHDEVAKIRTVMRHDLFEMEVDIQVVSGAYVRSTMVNMYRAIQNFIVKLSSRNSSSENYLLINSHFDSKPGSPGSGDDGAMVVVMLELLRVLATSRETFQHPIVFLFNGAEENALQASHGFITQHKWAHKCRALINLDSAGSGNREMLFQSGPNHPWLIKYYSRYAVRPFATTVAEELFQSNIIPSDTDFRIFRDYGHVPGLDFAHFYNGYVYHTKFDKYDVIPRGTLQATGDNILSLAKALANAPELEDTVKYAEGHAVFYDFLALFFVHYTETQGKIINTCVSLTAIVLVFIFLWLMAATCHITIFNILKTFLLILILHLVDIILAIALPLLLAVVFDSADRSMTWFTSKWLVLGLYVCPSLLGLCLPTLLYLNYNRTNKLGKSLKIQLILHAHAFVMAVLCIVGSFTGLRSSYLLTIPLFFYATAVIMNRITTLHRRGNLWCIFIALSQILPFIYTTYIFYIAISALAPMMGRFGSTINPDLIISTLCALGTILSMGFVMPLWNTFRHSKILLTLLVLVTFIFAMIAITPIGFPFRPKTNVGRIHFMNVRRVFREYDNSVSRNESGYFIDLQNRRSHNLIQQTIDPAQIHTLTDDCNNYMMCGLPIKMVRTGNSGLWLPTKDSAELPDPATKLTMLNKTFSANTSTANFEFELSGPKYFSIFLLPLEGVTVLDWTFSKKLLDKLENYKNPYHIYITCGKFSTPLKFSFEFKLLNKTIHEPLFKLGISGHYISTEYARGKDAEEFAKKFPDYTFIMEWPSSYERYIF